MREGRLAPTPLVEEAGPLAVAGADFPWLQRDVVIPTWNVTLPDGTEFRHGSLIGGNNTTRKLASDVATPESLELRNFLFAAVPRLVEGRPFSNVYNLDSPGLRDMVLLGMSKELKRKPHLAVVVGTPEAGGDLPTVLKVGTCAVNNYPKLMNTLRVKGDPTRILRGK